ncbi:MAG: serine hydrolase [Gemmatimonadetes bacterium]|nr:serine hydrolase [Gemmatimonadota bacterium]
MRRLLTAAFFAPALTLAQTPAAIDSIVTHALRTFGNQGVAVAVVKDGQVIVARGYGIKKLGTTDPVGPDTRFGIASNSKAFTATAIGILVEEGKLAWDAPVIRYLPEFAMYDPFVTRELTIRDLLVHRSGLGLGAGDLLWWPASTYDRKEIVRRLRFIKPATSFRSAYAYDNVLYLVAGEVIERVSGRTWEQFVKERILDRVGMTRSTVRHSDAAGPDDVATTHAEIEGSVRVIAPLTSDNTNPAGGINAGARDIAKWLLVQLDSGKLADGARLVSARTAREIWTGVTPMAAFPSAPELAPLTKQFNLYALGFQTNDFRGRKMLWHTGGLPGYLSWLGFIPDARVGVAVLTNTETPMYAALGWSLLDYALGTKPPWDFVGGYAAVNKRQRDALARQRTTTAAARDSLSKPSLPLAKYTGTYEDAWYGDVSVSLANGKLRLSLSHTPQLQGDLVHWQHDTFIARWDDREMRADAYVTFQLSPDGSIDQVKLRAFDPDTDFSFDFHDLLLRPRRPR